MSSYRRSFFKKLGMLMGGYWGGNSNAAAAAERHLPAIASGPQTRSEEPIRGQYDLIVVGGGISGTAAAISAARNGVKVALVHERSMLGGNSSSEVKLFPENNPAIHPWIRESGIHDEFHTEERSRNHFHFLEGTMNAHWDLVLYEWVIREPNITLFLDTHMHRVQMKNSSRIESVYCIQLGTEKSYQLSANLFVDATGTGILGRRAGADLRFGREAKDQYGEALAPDQADEKVMGNTLFFRGLDTGRPVPFKRPAWSAEFPSEDDLPSRGHSFIDGGYWWIEVGAPHHPFHDNDRIRHEGLRQLLGVWDHIKNRGDHGAENYGLEFVGFWPYKRESRRLLGDHVVTQHEVQDPQPLEDAVAYGCWGIDIHVQGGILTRDEPPFPSPRTDENWDSMGSQVYSIPLRSLYSRNVKNLMMAGRPISCSYLAFSSSRVLSTGCIVGQAVGIAAALCGKYGVEPAEVARKHARECQQIILRQDGHIPGVSNQDPKDLARSATASSSSEWVLDFPESDQGVELKYPHAQLFPVSGDRIDQIQLLLESKRSDSVELRVALRAASHVWDFRASQDLAEARASLAPGFSGWIPFKLGASVDPRKLYYLYLESSPGVFWKRFRETDGQPNRCPVGTTAADLPGSSRWRPLTQGRSLCLQVDPRPRPYSAENVIQGTNRPDSWTNIWISDPEKGLPTWWQLDWRQPVRFNTVEIVFDTDANRKVTLPLYLYPDCVKDYSLQVKQSGSWRDLLEVEGNYVRKRVHTFPEVRSSGLRLRVDATNGAPSTRLYEVRVYHEA